MANRDKTIHRKAKDYRWEGVDELPYKEDDRALFKSITRQVLFADPQLHGELRYFEVAPGGFSTLERHQHMHAVMILRGRGHCLVGEEVRPVETRDLITVPAMTWHQLRAAPSPLSPQPHRHTRQPRVAGAGAPAQARAGQKARPLPAQRADLVARLP